jgi:hypothetical protein
MKARIRRAGTADVPRIVDLSERKRTEYQEYQPRFWRKAADSREKQIPYVTGLLERENVIALVHERGGIIDGFVIATVVEAPPVYEPGGKTCLIDDFAVGEPEDWPIAGAALLAEANRRAKALGAVQTVVVCGHRDAPKREMLAAAELTIASEWYVREIG